MQEPEQEPEKEPKQDAPDGITARLGGRLATARADARRITAELTSRGILTPGEAAEIDARVATAVDHASEMVARATQEARRALATVAGSLHPALEQLEERLARVETTLADLAAGRAAHDDQR